VRCRRTPLHRTSVRRKRASRHLETITRARTLAPRCRAPSREHHASGRAHDGSPRCRAHPLRRTGKARVDHRSTDIEAKAVFERIEARMPVEQSQGSTCYGAVAGRGGPAPCLRCPLPGPQRSGSSFGSGPTRSGRRTSGARTRRPEEGNQASAETSQSFRFAEAVPTRRARQGLRFHHGQDGASASTASR